MNIKELENSFLSGQINSLYFVSGKDIHMIDKVVKDFLTKTPGLSMPELNASVIKDNFSFDRFSIELQTMPFASEKRVVVVHCSAISNDDLKLLASNFPSIPDSAIVVFVNYLADASEERSANKNINLLEKSLKKSLSVNCDAADIYSLSDYLIAEAAKYKVSLTRDVAQYLMSYVNADTETYYNELNKLINVCDGIITKEHINRYCIKNDEYKIFLLHGHLVKSEIEQAKVLFDEILRDNPNPVMLISMLSNSFSKMLTARLCLDAGYSNPQIINALKDTYKIKSDYQASSFIQQSKLFATERIREAIKSFSDIDYKCKHGEFNINPDLFGFLLKIYYKK